MEKDIHIIVKGVHEIEGDKEEFVTDTNGEYYLKNGKHYFKYTENTEYGDVRVLIKATDTSLEIMKSGAVNMQLFLYEGKVVAGTYDTLYGSIPIDLDTKKLTIEEENHHIKVMAVYNMMNADTVVAACELIIDGRD